MCSIPPEGSDHCFSCKTKCKFECFSICLYWVCFIPSKGYDFFFPFCHRCTDRNFLKHYQRGGTKHRGVLLSFRDDLLLLCVSYWSEFFLVYLECLLQLPLRLDMQKWSRISTETPPWRYGSSLLLSASLTKLFQSLSNVCSVLWVWLLGGFSDLVLEVIISHWLWQQCFYLASTEAEYF